MMLPESIERIDGELWYTVFEGDNSSLGYRVREILHVEQTPYQHLMILDTYDFGVSLVLDHIIQTTALDGYIYNEMITHMPLTLHKNPKHVLIIGGGDLGAANEVVKYPSIESVDVIEIDEAVVVNCQKYLPEVAGSHLDRKIHLHFEDGVHFIENTSSHYDIIIIDSSDPVGPAVELFSQPFYEAVYSRLSDNGIMSCQSLSPIYNAIFLRHIRDVLGLYFPAVETYTAVIPTYTGGLYSFTLAAKSDNLPPFRRAPEGKVNYVSADVLKSSFTHPGYVKKELGIEG